MIANTFADRFKRRLLDPQAWKQTAHHLFSAAALLETKIDEFWNRLRSGIRRTSSWRPWEDEFVAVYFMLCAYAIENMLKSHLIQKNRSQLEAELQSDLSLPKLLKQHDLYQLALDAGFEALAKYHEALLRSLTRSAVWYGRYPVPRVPEGLVPTYRSKNYDFELSLTQYSSADRDNIRRIAKELGYDFSLGQAVGSSAATGAIADDLGAVVCGLEGSRSPVSALNAPNGPGVYAFYLRQEGTLGPLRPTPSGLIYVGRSSNLATREFAHHFSSGKTGFSTIRRSLGAILKRELDLMALPRSEGPSQTNVQNYRFDPKGEERLTSWMGQHLEVGVCEVDKPELVESELIAQLRPILNLKGWDNPDRRAILQLRRACADEARSHRRVRIRKGHIRKPYNP